MGYTIPVNSFQSAIKLNFTKQSPACNDFF